MLQLNFSPFPVLTTERLLLRQLTTEDENEIFSLRSDDAVNKYLDRLKARSPEEARKFILKINRNISNNELIVWGIQLKEKPKIIGTACYWNISAETNTAEIGYELLPPFQGNGIMQEALTAIIHYGHETMKLETIEAFANVKNKPSLGLLEKHGFNPDAGKQKVIDKKEEMKDMLVFTRKF